jgi:hypothetical protein
VLGPLQGSQESGEVHAPPDKPARDGYGHARK